MQPLISVVIPFYNAERYLNDTIASLAEQTFRDFEVVVVDDGCHSAASRRALQAAMMAQPPYVAAVNASSISPDVPFPVRFVCHADNRGLAAARNSGASASRGVLVAFLDPDDTLHPTALEKLALLAAHLRSFPGASSQYRNRMPWPRQLVGAGVCARMFFIRVRAARAFQSMQCLFTPARKTLATATIPPWWTTPSACCCRKTSSHRSICRAGGATFRAAVTASASRRLRTTTTGCVWLVP